MCVRERERERERGGGGGGGGGFDVIYKTHIMHAVTLSVPIMTCMQYGSISLAQHLNSLR